MEVLDEAIQAYLAKVEQGLGLLGPLRRRRVLRELEGDLRDALPEAWTPEGREAWLATLTAPEELAGELGRAERQAMRIHILGGLVFCLSMAGVVCICALRHRSAHAAVAFGMTLGFTVGVALLALRSRWMHLRAPARMAWAVAVGALAGVPWGWCLAGGIHPFCMAYGGLVGYFSERAVPPVRPMRWVLDNLVTTLGAILIAGTENHWVDVDWMMFPWVALFHAALQGGLYLGFRVRKTLILRML